MNSSIGRARLFFLVFLAALAAPASAFSQYLLDTGPGGSSSIGGTALIASGSTTCSPQPQCAQSFQFLAVRLVLPAAATVSSVELWVGQFGSGGGIDVKIREEIPATGLPATNAPPLFSPNSVYSKRYTAPNVIQPAQWLTFTGYEAVLAAGTYWVTFEPVAGSGLNYGVPIGPANPAPKYAFWANGNPGYRDHAPKAFGVRVGGTTFPGIAFGTATRLTSTGSTGGAFCCSFDYDFVQEGTRHFTPLGTQGAPLTSTYIFVLGNSHDHGRGLLNANGLSAGAYSTNGSLAVGSGRGVAFRTFLNMSDQPRTFRLNANFHGAYFNAGGLGRAGIYAFDTALFSSTIAASGKTPGHFLLDADGRGALANPFSNISPARFFPAEALLADDQKTADFPTGVGTTVPMATDFITLAPGGTVTVLFDVAVNAPAQGSANFGNTLSSAPVFLTDENGAPVVDVVAVGPSSPAPGTPATMALTPASASIPVGTTHAVTATVTTASGTPVPDADVTFTITSGPNAGAPSVVTTDVNGEAVFSYLGTLVGADSIQATLGALPAASATTTWTVGAVDRITVAPKTASLPVGETQTFTTTAFDVLSNTIGTVTADTTFTIAPDGTCTGAGCTATTAGVRTVTASYLGKTDEATLTFTGVGGGYTFTGFFEPVDNLPVVNTVKAGSSVPLKFSLGGNQGLDIFAPGHPVSQAVACVGSAPEDVVEQIATPGTSGLFYDPVTGQYSYVWKTDKTWAGKCRQLIVTLKDGSSHLASFKFK